LDVVCLLVQFFSHLSKVLDDDAEDDVQTKHVDNEENAEIEDVANVVNAFVAWQERRPHDHVSYASC
jgi:NADPH-dependent glutamate synthase beta subunit-like oxidoreductase